LSPITLAERGLLPDAVVRLGIRRLLRQRLAELRAAAPDGTQALEQFAARMDAAPIALLANKANEQHYEIDAEFFDTVLGAQRKYSCCYWDASTATLDDAEEHALRVSGEHACLAFAVDRAAFSQLARHRRIELELAARLHHAAGAARGARQRERDPRGRERIRYRAAL
jgi:Mycolic acid cyclopropane synthetase